MIFHKPIEFVDGAVMKGNTILPSTELLPQLFSKISNGIQGALGARRFPPILPQSRSFASAEQVGCLKPTQEGAEIREQFQGFAVLDRTGIQEVESAMVAKEEEPFFPVRDVNCSSLCHFRYQTDDNTDNESFYRLVNLML